MGEIAHRALHPLPIARELRKIVLRRLEEAGDLPPAPLPVPAGKLARFRQLVVDVVGPAFDRQAQWQVLVSDAVRQLEAVTTVVDERLRSGWLSLDQRLGDTQRSVDAVRDRVALYESMAGTVATMQITLAEMEAQVEHLQEELEAERRLRQEHRAATAAAAAVPVPKHQPSLPDGRSGSAFDDLYVPFEARFRGSPDEVQLLQRPYLIDLRQSAREDLSVLDVGPGRGEWLELLADEGIKAYGVDLNESMVAIGRSAGVEILHGDALEHLRNLDPGSLRAVTAFHFVEHISLDMQIEFLRAVVRALCPGGLIVLETPNPTNLVVGAAAFYLDPTHLRPVHPQLLEFLVEVHGFEEIELRFLHAGSSASATIAVGDGSLDEAVWWALRGPQDFAVLGRKPLPVKE